MARLEFRNRWVLVTGASSGLGKEMARQLAGEYGANVILVARREAVLKELADEITSKYATKAHVIAADLTKKADVTRLFEASTEFCEVYGVILNAGITYLGKALDYPLEDFERLLATNVTSVVHLTGLFTPYLIDKNSGGGLLFVSSMGGFNPLPFQAHYGAAKAFVTNFGQALAEENKHKNVTISVFAPGGIATEMLDSAGLSKKFKAGDVGIMSADQCARLALQGFAAKERVFVNGSLNKLTTIVTKLAPRNFVTGRIAALYQDLITD